MSNPVTGSLTKKKVRYVRDSDDRIIEIREFDYAAGLNNYCHALVIERDPATNSIVGFYTQKSTVSQEDLDATS